MAKKVIQTVPVSKLTLYKCDYCNFTDKRPNVVKRHELQYHKCKHINTDIIIDKDWDGYSDDLILKCKDCERELFSVEFDLNKLIHNKSLINKTFEYMRFVDAIENNKDIDTKLCLIGGNIGMCNEFRRQYNISRNSAIINAYDPDKTLRGISVKYYIHLDKDKRYDEYMKKTFPNAEELILQI